MNASALLMVAILFAPAVAVAQFGVSAPPSGLGIGYRVEEYFGEAYTEPPRQSLVFFQGEPVLFRVTVGNRGPGDALFVMESPDPQRLFEIRAFHAPFLPSNGVAERPLAADRRRFADERDVTVPIDFSSPFKGFSGGFFDVQLGRDFLLAPAETLNWRMKVASEDLEPGYYRVDIHVNGTQEGNTLREFASIRFEVRGRMAEAQPELIRREAMRRVERRDYAGAREAAADLIKIHPTSVVALVILERIAAEEGKQEEAARHRATAAEMRTSGRDELLLKYEKLRRGN